MATNATVLIAEDESVSRRLMEASLLNWGYKVLVAQDGDEACSLLQRNAASVCILDWGMPGKDGIEVCQWIRTNLWPRPYIIMLTGRTDAQEVELGRRAGVNVYMTKPFDRAALKEHVAKAFAGQPCVEKEPPSSTQPPRATPGARTEDNRRL